ncbi:hypothetical protein ACSBR2_008057 [Camellia fascicularis]
MYVCLGAIRRGFLSSVRPLIGLDDCFLKGPCQGQLFAAIGWDGNGNNQMYPIAYVVAKAECKESWTWFIHNLLQDIGPIEEHEWAFMADQQKGLVPSLRLVCLEANHRFYFRHLYANFKKSFKGKELKDCVWKAAKAYTRVE